MAQQYLATDFVHEIQSRYSTIEAATFWACESVFARFLEEGAAEKWLNDQLRTLTPTATGPGELTPKEALVHRGEGWAISLTVLDTQTRFIHLAPYLAFCSPLAGELTADRFRLPAGFRNDVFDPTVRLVAADSVTVKQKQVLRLDSTQFAYDFRISQPIPIVRFSSRPIQPLEWLFSKANLQAWQANDADIHLTQLRVAAQVLGKIAHQSSVEPLLRLSRHPHHAVRWIAIQSLGRLNRTAALARIREVTNDPHPHVRRAAQKTLQQLEAGKAGK